MNKILIKINQIKSNLSVDYTTKDDISFSDVPLLTSLESLKSLCEKILVYRKDITQAIKNHVEKINETKVNEMYFIQKIRYQEMIEYMLENVSKIYTSQNQKLEYEILNKEPLLLDKVWARYYDDAPPLVLFIVFFLFLIWIMFLIITVVLHSSPNMLIFISILTFTSGLVYLFAAYNTYRPDDPKINDDITKINELISLHNDTTSQICQLYDAIDLFNKEEEIQENVRSFITKTLQSEIEVYHKIAIIELIVKALNYKAEEIYELLFCNTNINHLEKYHLLEYQKFLNIVNSILLSRLSQETSNKLYNNCNLDKTSHKYTEFLLQALKIDSLNNTNTKPTLSPGALKINSSCESTEKWWNVASYHWREINTLDKLIEKYQKSDVGVESATFMCNQGF